jgi:hypothetical protein
MTQPVLDVLAEDRQEQHVAEDVVPAAVHEHGREPAERPRLGTATGPVERAGVERRVRDRRVQLRELVHEPHRETRNDQRDGDVGESPRGDAI